MLLRSCRPLQSQHVRPRRFCCSSPWLSEYARRYATAPGHDEPTNAFGSITTRSPQTTSIEELLAELRSASPFVPITKGATGPSLLALFLTPTYAQHALDPELPLRALEQLHGSRKSTRDVKSVVAVVDRLPGDAIPGTRLIRGAEGLAYTFLGRLSREQEEVLSDRTLQDSSTLSSKQLSQPRPGTLSFGLSALPDLRVCDADLSIPLAQTTFSTGLVSTMVSATHKPDPQRDSILTTQEPPVALDSQRIPMTFKSDIKSICGINMNIPLKPLTHLRRVEHCMGNIIRSLSSEPSHVRNIPGEASSSEEKPAASEPQPASSELESAIQSFFSSNELAPQPVQVWALILPANIKQSARLQSPRYQEKLEALFQSEGSIEGEHHEPWFVSTVLQRLIVHCNARLCRVLSGGGGWGKKAGLLSLDPESRYGGDLMQQSLAGDESPRFGSIEDLEEAKMSALGDIVKKGEHVMFFLGPPSPNHEFSAEGRAATVSPWSASTFIPPAPSRRLLFGCLPSSVDDVSQPPVTSDATNSSQAERILHQQNRFGVLSEGGLAFASTVAKDPKVTRSNQTKVDVPFAHISLQQPTSFTGLEDELDRREKYGGIWRATSTIRRVRSSGDGESPQSGSRSLNDTDHRSFVDRLKQGGHDGVDLAEFVRQNTKTLDPDEFAKR